MVGEPRDESIKASHIHRINSFVEKFGGLRQNLWHCARLQLAKFDQNGAVSNLDKVRVGQAEQLTKHYLDYHVFQWNLVLQRVAQQLSSTSKKED